MAAVKAGQNDRAKPARSFNPGKGKKGGSTKDPVKEQVLAEAAANGIGERTATQALMPPGGDEPILLDGSKSKGVGASSRSATAAAAALLVPPDDLGGRVRARDCARSAAPDRGQSSQRPRVGCVDRPSRPHRNIGADLAGELGEELRVRDVLLVASDRAE